MLSAVALAAASISTALVLADTQQAQIDLRFDLQRSNRVVIVADSPAVRGFPQDRLEDAAELKPVEDVGEFSIWAERVPTFRSVAVGASTQATLIVADPGGLKATQTALVAGSSFDLISAAPDARFAWVGQEVARELDVSPRGTDGPVGPDAQILIRGVPFSVVGVITNSEGFDYVSNSVVVSRSAAISTVGAGASNVRLVASVQPGSARAVGSYLIDSIDPSRTQELRDTTPPDGEVLMGGVGSDLRVVGLALGLFIGLVGIVSIANTLVLSVYQRFPEIGLRSALGWSRGRIGALVMVEAALAGTLAGAIGTALGLAAASVWCGFQGWSMVVSPLVPIIAVGGGLLASLVGGVGPALRAASVSPLEAMRA